MKLLSRLAITGLSVVALVLASANFNEPAIAAPSLQTLNLVGGNTDASHAVGSQDPYTETSTDGGTTWRPAYLVGGTHPWGLVSGTNSWINCGPSLNDCLNATSLYRYRFWVPADFTSPYLNGSMIMDNYGSVYLNGQTLVSSAPANYTFPANTNLSGKLVAGWNELRVELLDVGGLTGINFNLQVAVTSSSSMTLASPGRLVMYSTSTGTVSRASDTLASGDVIRAFPTGTLTGYQISGWWTASTGGTQVSASNAVPFNPSGDTTLYARWSLANYNIIYDEQGGSTATDDTYQMGGAVTLAAAPTRSGFTFDGWFDAATSGTKYGATFSPPATGDLTIYAHWTAVPSSSGGSGSSNTPSPSPTPGSSPSDVSKEKELSRLITTFTGDKSYLKSAMFKELNKVAAKLSNRSVLTCVGSTSGVLVTEFDKKLAAARAKEVCSYLAGKVSGLKFTTKINPSSANKVSARHVWVYAKFIS